MLLLFRLLLSARHWRHTDGTCTKSDWELIDGSWYYFDADGWMMTGWVQVKGKWYYLGSDGAMTTGLQTIGGKWYYLDDDGAMATEPVVLTPDKDGALQYPGLSQ